MLINHSMSCHSTHGLLTTNGMHFPLKHQKKATIKSQHRRDCPCGTASLNAILVSVGNLFTDLLWFLLVLMEHVCRTCTSTSGFTVKRRLSRWVWTKQMLFRITSNIQKSNVLNLSQVEAVGVENMFFYRAKPLEYLHTHICYLNWDMS